MSDNTNPFVKPHPVHTPGQVNAPDLRHPDTAYAGTCIICLTGTDTGLAFEGELEWLAAGLTHLGMPFEQAVITVTDSAPPVDGRNRTAAAFRVCRPCAAKTNFPEPALLIATGDIPCIAQPA